jgi:hypothetical protein
LEQSQTLEPRPPILRAWSRAHAFVLDLANPWTMGTLAFLVYMIANNHQYMHFNYYTHLAESFLKGKMYVENPPPWLTEFTWHNGHAYLYYGPLPAVILVPLVAIFHQSLNLAYVSIVVGAFNVGLAFLLLTRLGCARATTFWLTLIFAFGSVHFWVSEYGNNWLFSQVVAVLFLLLGAAEAFGKKRSWLVGLSLGAAILSRNACLLALPFYLVALNLPKPHWKKAAGFLVALGVMAALNGWYNWARFGNPLDNGYLAGEAALLRPEHGSFSLHYLVKMMPAYLWRGPTLYPHWPYLGLTDHGLSIFWTTPPFLYLIPAAAAFWAFRPVLGAEPVTAPFWKDRTWWMTFAAWSAVVPMAGLYLCYVGDGWRQFGARYSLDYTPFLLAALGIYFRDRLPAMVPKLAVLAFAINIWGVAWWRILGW